MNNDIKRPKTLFKNRKQSKRVQTPYKFSGAQLWSVYVLKAKYGSTAFMESDMKVQRHVQ